MSDLGGLILLRFILHPAHSEALRHSKSHLAFLLGSGLTILPPGTQRAWHLLFPANQQQGDTKGYCQCHDYPDEFMFLCSYFYLFIINYIICSELVVIVICFLDTIRSTEMSNSFLGLSNCCGWIGYKFPEGSWVGTLWNLYGSMTQLEDSINRDRFLKSVY